MRNLIFQLGLMMQLGIVAEMEEGDELGEMKTNLMNSVVDSVNIQEILS